jgi:hypothetical protein
MPRTRLSIALYLVLVFGSGILVGIVSNRLYATSTASASTSPRSIPEFRKRYLTGMRTKVGASEAQISAITKQLDETQQKYDDLAKMEQPLHDKIQEDHIEAIKALLSPQQVVAYDNWRAERARAKAAQQPQKK